MEGMPTIPGKDPQIMTSGEIAIAKRREKLNDLLQHGDPFTDRLICSFFQIACIAKEIVETEKIPRYGLGPGINGSKIFEYGPSEFGKDFSCIKPIRDKLNEQMEKFRIGYGLWEYTYSFDNYEQLVKEILSVLLDKSKQVTEDKNGID
jgi:hypothetical protein